MFVWRVISEYEIWWLLAQSTLNTLILIYLVATRKSKGVCQHD